MPGEPVIAPPQAREGGPFPRLVAVVDTTAPATLAAALAGGADGVVSASANPRDLVHAVRAATAGYVALPLRLAHDLIGHNWPADVPPLSGQELDMMRRLATGATIADVAGETGLSERELHRRLASLYARLGVGSRIEAAVVLAERGLLGR